MVRILHFHFWQHETSIIHSHPDGVAVYLTDGKITLHLPDDKTVDASGEADPSRTICGRPAMSHRDFSRLTS